MTLPERIQLFVQLGKILGKVSEKKYFPNDNIQNQHVKTLEEAVQNAVLYNGWFTEEFVRIAMHTWSIALNETNISLWISRYEIPDELSDKTVAVIMAGNIPLVGFHDLLCILIAGFKVRIKLSHTDEVLMKAVINVLMALKPALSDRILFTDNKLSNFDAVIATGSNNSTRYFDYYFSKYPNIIRGNRTSVAVLTGKESEQDMNGLAHDICMYFGLGCRNVTHVFIPEGYDPGNLLKINEKYADSLMLNKKYANNYLYNKAILHLNTEVHYDGDFMLLRETDQLHSAVSVLNYSFYKSIDDIKDIISLNSENIQAVVSISTQLLNAVAPGKAQFPELWEYADNVDTMKFLNLLKNNKEE